MQSATPRAGVKGSAPDRPARWLWRHVFHVLALTWAWLMIVVGLLAILEWPARVPAWDRALYVIGAMLLAMGQFVLALVAARLFPAASARLTATFELLAWIAIASALVLGVVL
ncbi:MAG: hypothetical protein H7Y88_03125 [Phycisphaerales bacterium]|nr:hypothetical protein [Phycisphaerales bacterium]